MGGHNLRNPVYLKIAKTKKVKKFIEKKFNLLSEQTIDDKMTTTNSIFVLLPADIFYIILNFLLFECRDDRQVFKFSSEWRNFCNTSKKYGDNWKKKTQIINLKPLYSDKFCKSSKFRERIYGMIESAQEQINLNFNHSWSNRRINLSCCQDGVRQIVADGCMFSALPCFPIDYLSLRMCAVQHVPSTLSPIRRFHCSGSTFKNLSFVDVCKLNILEEAAFENVKLENYSQLAHLQSLSISLCESITDVSYFQKIRKLKIHYCINVIDVSSLGNVHELVLVGCHGITDVSSLGRVYHLSLSDCENIRDVSALGNVHMLNLDCCPEVMDISALANVYEIHLNEFKGNDVSGLLNVVKLVLHFSLYVTDISMLTKLEVLDLYRCPGITRFEGLDHLKEFSIDGYYSDLVEYRGDPLPFKIPSSTAIELFLHLTKFTARGMILEPETPIDVEPSSASSSSASIGVSISINWQHFGNLRALELVSCPFQSFPKTFPQLRSLKISHCEELVSLILEGLPSLLEFSLEGCENIKAFHFISLAINDKPNTVTVVKLSACNLVDVFISRKVNDLRLVSCPELVKVTIQNAVGRLSVTDCPKLKNVNNLAPINIIFNSCNLEENYSLAFYEDD
jgi:hypothetical protein